MLPGLGTAHPHSGLSEDYDQPWIASSAGEKPLPRHLGHVRINRRAVHISARTMSALPREQRKTGHCGTSGLCHVWTPDGPGTLAWRYPSVLLPLSKRRILVYVPSSAALACDKISGREGRIDFAIRNNIRTGMRRPTWTVISIG